MRGIGVVIVGCALLSCSAQVENRPAHVRVLDIYPATESRCAAMCGVPVQPDGCAERPETLDYLFKSGASLFAALAMQGEGDIPKSECVCVRLHFLPNGEMTEVTIERATSHTTAERVGRAFESLASFPPLPKGASCLLATPHRSTLISIGGGRQ
jgi:hypothetical protein